MRPWVQHSGVFLVCESGDEHWVVVLYTEVTKMSHVSLLCSTEPTVFVLNAFTDSGLLTGCVLTVQIPFFVVSSRRSPHQSSAVTSHLTTSSSWPAQETKRPLCMKSFTKATTDWNLERQKCHVAGRVETKIWLWLWNRLVNMEFEKAPTRFYLMSVRDRHWGRTVELHNRIDLVVFLMLWES